jgi:hypothetical protein
MGRKIIREFLTDLHFRVPLENDKFGLCMLPVCIFLCMSMEVHHPSIMSTTVPKIWAIQMGLKDTK